MDNTHPGGTCGVFELRQYTMQPGQRDTLITIFERHFIEAQEALGMTVYGQFRDRARADRFVFLRGFPDMASRQTALEDFYNGEVWAEQRDAANATMIDWHDVLMLRPARPDTVLFDLNIGARPAIGAADATPPATVFAGVHGLRAPADERAIAVFEQQAVPVLRDHGVRVDALLVSEPSPNTYTRLPIREGEHVLVWIGTRDDDATRTGAGATAAALTSALGRIGDLTALARDRDPLIVLELEPTSRSLLGRQRTRRRSQADAIK